jgi:soluble lytic murein transglycosylase
LNQGMKRSGLLGLVWVGCVGMACAQTASTTSKHKHTTGTTSSHSSAPVPTTTKASTHAAGSRSHGSTAHAVTSHTTVSKSKSSKSSSHTTHRTAASVISHHGKHVAATAESQRLTRAFVASAQLRPMAQQLLLTRSPASFAGVRTYAASHPGEGAAAASLALGHAEMLDHKYDQAAADFRQSSLRGGVLSDYADFLAAQADVSADRASDAIPLLANFTTRHPDSLFVPRVPLLLASAYLASNDPTSALRVLQPVEGTAAGAHADVRAALARAYQLTGNAARATTLWRGIYLGDPLAPEAANAKTQLGALNAPLSAAERKQHADAMFNAKQYAQAADEYRALQKSDSSLSQADRDALEIYAAVCDLRLKKLSRSDVTHLPTTNDDTAALKLYLVSELARNDGAFDEHDDVVRQIEAAYPNSRWLEEALYSGGNMYLVRGDAARAVTQYTELCARFPKSVYAPSAHWHAAWLNYRLRRYADAAKLMDEQIAHYPAGDEVPGALYWRGRLLEDVEHDPAQAANYYRALSDAYIDSYYAMLGRQRLSALGSQSAATPAPVLASVRSVGEQNLTAELPENDPHLIKARLLANAALNEYIRPELQLSDVNGEWSMLAEAEIYQSFGEDTRALQAMKRSKLPFFSLPVSEVPMPYWQILFPRPYWTQLSTDAAAHGLDPYLVAALIRQESEFNAGAVSRANAYGLMQLLPAVGKSLAKREGNKHFSTNELLDPSTNLQLGTIDLKASIDRWDGHVEYALAAYNAGDTPVKRWVATNDYKDMPEWVESIPYTETREYVQAIVRNREMYRAIYAGK